MNINDPTNLTHLSDLVNQYTVNKNLDLEAIEKDMIGTTSRRAPEIDPNEAFRAAMQELTQDIGINLDGNVNFSDFSDNQQPKKSAYSNNNKGKSAAATVEYEDGLDELNELEEAATTTPDRSTAVAATGTSDNFLDELRKEYDPKYSTVGNDEGLEGIYDNDKQINRTPTATNKQPLRPRGYQ